MSSAICRANATAFEDDIVMSSSGRSYNSGGTTRALVCPMPRTSPYVWEAIEITVLDRHYNYDVTCTAYYASFDGSVGSVGTYQTMSTSGSSSSWQSLTRGKPSIGAQYAWGNAYAYCTIPGMYSGNTSGIASIHVWDNR